MLKKNHVLGFLHAKTYMMKGYCVCQEICWKTLIYYSYISIISR